MPEAREAGKPVPEQRSRPQAEGWGKEPYPYPKGPAAIECDEMKCVGCGICQMACSMQHFGVINKELARIQVRKYLLPLPKGVQMTCVQCAEEERECQKACPQAPPAVYFDRDTLHMVVDVERCLGLSCLLCVDACPARAMRVYRAGSDTPFVCDLCDTDNSGQRDPQCVNVCPCGALSYKSISARFGYSIQDLLRKHPDEKADLIARRLYPLTKTSMGNPGWR
ncbi:MAG: 4Fe-4S dicluster domain-containing protein [Chloroflexi bacterium]|nr:4Fe-4S dicluster domain-containing protein [Chloroflexota bacterium]